MKPLATFAAGVLCIEAAVVLAIGSRWSPGRQAEIAAARGPVVEIITERGIITQTKKL